MHFIQKVSEKKRVVKKQEGSDGFSFASSIHQHLPFFMLLRSSASSSSSSSEVFCKGIVKGTDEWDYCACLRFILLHCK